MTTVLDPIRAERLVERLRGPLLVDGHHEYEEARSVYNAMIDRRPAAIARCRDVADVIAVVDFAREGGDALAVRGGGHNGAGFGTIDDGVVLDLSPMAGVGVDPARRCATVQGGALVGDVDHAAHVFGLATPTGVVSTTGVGGLTLGGGHGYLSRRYGLTIDNLVSADVVLADGSFVTASEERHEDLFWALRGGGGNFGVVTSFTFRLHPVNTIVGGPTIWSLDDADTVLRWYREWLPQADADTYAFFGYLTVPPAAPFPEHLHGREGCCLVWCYLGSPDRADAAFAPALQVAEPLLHGVQPMPYPMLQGAFDALYPQGDQWYWRGDFFAELPDGAVEQHDAFARRLPSPQSLMHLYPIDGAAQDVEAAETAFGYRDARWSMVIAGVDHDPASAAAIKEWTVDYSDALHGYSLGGSYVNFLMDEGEERVQSTYRGNYERLRRIKSHYDPHNLFRTNQNIPPAPA